MHHGEEESIAVVEEQSHAETRYPNMASAMLTLSLKNLRWLHSLTTARKIQSCMHSQNIIYINHKLLVQR